MSSSGKKKGEPDACGILANLWQLVQSVLDESEPDLDGLGLSPKTFFLLTAVEEHPFPAELARRMHLPPPTVTYMIKQLEERGFLGRRAEPGDLRKFRLVQTVAGREALRQGRETLSAILVERLLRLDREDVQAFDRIVKRLVERNGVSWGS
jgi:MarR family transcriptional regulator, organic hydroperoxide resistance regulator